MLNPFMGLGRRALKAAGGLLGRAGEEAITPIAKAAAKDLNSLAGSAGKAFWGTNPNVTMRQARSKIVTELADELMHNPMALEKNMQGIASRTALETMKKTDTDSLIALGKTKMYDEFIKYRMRLAGKREPIGSRGVMSKMASGLESTGRVIKDRFMEPAMDRPPTYFEFRRDVTKAKRRLGYGYDLSIFPPEVIAAAKHLDANGFAVQREFSKRVGLLTEKQVSDMDYNKSYVPQTWRLQDIREDPLGFEQFVERNKRMEIADILAKTTDADTIASTKARNPAKEAEAFRKKIMKSPNGIATKQILDEVYPIRGGGAEKHRDLIIHKSMLAEAEDNWLENDMNFLFPRHIKEEYSRALLKERFGSVNMKKQLEAIGKDYDDMIKKSSDPLERRDLASESKYMLNATAAMRDKLLGIYKLPDDPYSIPHRISESFLKLNPTVALGGVMPSSVPDLGRFVMRYGAGNTAKMLSKFITNYSESMLSMKEFRELAGSFEMVLGSRYGELTEMGGASGVAHTWVERAIEGAHDAMGMITLLTPWNHTMKSFTAFLAGNYILEAAEKAAKGMPLSKNILSKMAEDGFSLAELKALASMPYKHVNGVRIPQSANWTDRALADKFRYAVRREMDMVIVTPGIGDRSLWMSTEMGRHIGQFKSFSMASTNAMLIPSLQYHDMETLSGLLLSIFLGANVYALKQKIAGMEVNTDPRKLLAEGIDRSGMLGWLGDANAIAERVSRGRIGVNPLMGTPGMSRYAYRSILDTIVGPTAGTIEYMTKTAGASLSGEWSKEDLRAARRLLPYTNVFYMRQIFDKLEANLADTFQLEEQFKIDQRKRKAARLQ